MSWVRVDQILDLLFTPHCVLCGQTVAIGGQPACAGCLADLPWLADADALLPQPGWRLPAWSALSYEYPVDRLVALAKFGRRLPVARALGELLACRGPTWPVMPDAVVPVPLHWRREAQRGFNQAEEIARALCSARGWPLRTDLCRRLRPTPEQSGLGAGARQLNLQDAFALCDAGLAASQQRILVIDDVLTTGATGLAVASLFRTVGVPDIRLWTVARTPPPA